MKGRTDELVVRGALWSRRVHYGRIDSDRTVCGIRHFDTSLYELDGECGNCLRLLPPENTDPSEGNTHG